MVEAGNVTAALLELGSPELEQAKALDLVEPLDWESIEPDPMFEEAKDSHGFGYQYYSTIMAWRTDAKPLTSLRDLWNVDEFPGKRAFPHNLRLTADVDLDQLHRRRLVLGSDCSVR
jgi:putative spermidine/putrescine transport system substrate-binding protein